MAEYLPPIAGGSDARIVPGPVHGGACPPPKEIVVVEVRKVFDFCFQEETLDRCFFVPGLGPGAAVTDCQITNVTCREALPRQPLQDQEGLSVVSVGVTLELSITIAPTPGAPPVTITRNIAFPKRIVLCAPAGTDVTCDVRGTCVCAVQPPANGAAAAAAEPNVCCTILLCIFVKTTADVNILIPTFGVVLPKPCDVTAAFVECPPAPPRQCPPRPRGTIVKGDNE